MSKQCGGSNAPNPVYRYGRRTGCPVCSANPGVSTGGTVAPHSPNHASLRR